MPIYVLEMKYESVMTAFKADSDDEAKARLYEEYGYFSDKLYDDFILTAYKRGRRIKQWNWVHKLGGGYWSVDGV